jgi:hypothetical protein
MTAIGWEQLPVEGGQAGYWRDRALAAEAQLADAARHREQARAEAIEQAQADDGWLPIEQAPRDGTRILVAKIGWIFKDVVEAFKDGHEPAEQGWHLYFATTAYYAADKGYWTDGLEKLVEPTHWRSVGPLPAPPRSSPLPLGGSGGVRGG